MSPLDILIVDNIINIMKFLDTNNKMMFLSLSRELH